jgi:hypothetical protein
MSFCLIVDFGENEFVYPSEVIDAKITQSFHSHHRKNNFSRTLVIGAIDHGQPNVSIFGEAHGPLYGLEVSDLFGG